MDNSTKLNSLSPEERHSVGATVIHESAFSDLETYSNEFNLGKPFITKWLQPFYNELPNSNDNLIARVKSVKSEITPDIIKILLGDFNWRTRQTGAFFSAVKNDNSFVDIIGIHLLKSEVCFAGNVYAKVLAYFNKSVCVIYLEKYLNYYLQQTNLYFDQRAVLEALSYLDKINNTNFAEKHQTAWLNFIKNKPHWEKEITTESTEKFIETINKINL